jgi:uncharacterized surface protein with fasciclin (FAS1) repeats
MRLNSFRRIATALALASAVLAFTVPAAMAKSVVVPPSKASDSIVAIASGNPAFSTLVTAVGCADPAVAAALTSGQQLTVFAPTDAAFGGLGLTAANVCALPQGTLTAILLYHVQEGRHFSNSVLPKFPGHSKTIDTLLGQSFRVDAAGSITTASGATSPSIVAANIPATNGVIHVVDAVLIPSL